MKRVFFFTAIASMLLWTSPAAYAQKTKGGAPFVVTKATTRNSISTSGRGHNETETRFSIVWKSKAHPKGIFYRPDPAHWLMCKITRPEKRPFGGGPNDYMLVDVVAAPSSLKAGESLDLTPEEYPSEVQPEAVKSMPAGALFYQLANSNKWQTVKVKMTRLPDVKRP
jgi:hypothetical protein